MRHLLLALSVSFAALACSRRAPAPTAVQAFEFLVRPPAITSTGESWDAVAVLPGDTARSGPATFRIVLAEPGRRAAPGTVIQGVLRHGDPGGYRHFLINFAPVFAPDGPTGGMQLDPTDSLPITIRVLASAQGGRPLSATVQLPNGGQLLLSLDSARGRGTFTPTGREYNPRVMSAIASLVVSAGP